MEGDTNQDPDRPLVEAAAAGNREAFDELVKRHQARIFNLARALTADDGEAEDLAQEAFIRAFRALRTFRGESTFRTWLYRIAINVSRSYSKRRALRKSVWTRFSDTGNGDGEEPDPGDEGFEWDMIWRDAIDRALRSLPTDLRAAVTLRDVEGLEYREIAAILGVPMGTVESRIFRARQRLRPLLEPLFLRRDRPESVSLLRLTRGRFAIASRPEEHEV